MTLEFSPRTLKPKDFLKEAQDIYNIYGNKAVVGFPNIQSVEIPKITLNAQTCLIGVYGLTFIQIYHLYDVDARKELQKAIGEEPTQGIVGFVPGLQNQRRITELADLGIKPYIVKPSLFAPKSNLNLIALPDKTVLFSYANISLSSVNK